MAAHDRNGLDAKSPAPEPRKLNSPQGSTALPGLNSSPDAMSLLKALRRRWFVAGALGVLLASVAGVAAWVLLPAKFTAFALLQVTSKPNSFTERIGNREEFAIFMKTTAARLKSRDVLMRTLSEDQVRHLRSIKKHPDTLSTLTWMEEVLKVEIQDNSELLTVSLTGEDPNDLQTIVNNMVKSFINIVGKEDKGRRNERLEKTKLMYEDAHDKLRQKLAKKDNMLKTSNVKDPWAMMNQLQNTQSELRQAQSDFVRHRLELERKTAQLLNLEATKKTLDKTVPPEMPAKDLLDSDPTLRKDADLKDRLVKLIERLLREGHRDDDLNVRQARSDLLYTTKRIDERTAQVRADFMQKMRAKQENDLDVAIVHLQADVEPLKKFVSEMKDLTNKLTDDLTKINISTKKFDEVDEEISREKKHTDLSFEVYKQAQREQDAEPRVTPIGEAELQNRDLKKRVMMIILAPITAFLAMLLAVAWWEFSARRIHEPAEVVAGLAMRVVGAVPEMPDVKRGRLNVDPQTTEILQHNLIESIDAIRTMLLRNASTENLRVVMVTSAVGGEGKTTLASNLAMSLARAGRKTLLMDCDLRRPTAHELFEQTVQPGFSEVVLNEIDLPDAVRVTTMDPNLHLLPAGLWDRDVVQELAKNGITSIFEKLRDEFDFIIVDSHPVLSATDSLLIGQHVDAVLVSLMRDVSQMHNVHTACQQFASLGIRVFGAVVNGVPVKSFGKTYQPAVPAPQTVS